jgi:hypothetical protein
MFHRRATRGACRREVDCRPVFHEIARFRSAFSAWGNASGRSWGSFFVVRSSRKRLERQGMVEFWGNGKLVVNLSRRGDRWHFWDHRGIGPVV